MIFFLKAIGKGDPSDPNNYRGITLKSHFLKLFETIICNRFTFWCTANEMIPEEQLAYRKGFSGTDHLYLLNVLIGDAVARGRVLYVGLIDLRKAFPSVDRQELMLDLVQAGVSSKAVQMFKRLYDRDTFQLLLDGVPGTVVFSVVVGVHEGSCLSPSLSIFFIRDLCGTLSVLATNIDCPVVGGRKLFCMVFADDVNVFSLKIPGTQQLVDGTTGFFTRRRLMPNPDKCEFLAITGPRHRQQATTCKVEGQERPWLPSARCLGLIFENTGRWDTQLSTALSRARSALDRCKIMVSTVGRHRVKVALELFDSVVASVYRYGFGVWGIAVRQVNKLDDLFVEFVPWLFRLPSRTGRNVILASFARRCAKCDALFIAASQLATAAGATENAIWADAVRDLRVGQLRSAWFQVVSAELAKRGFREEVLERGAEFLGERKRRGVEFSQYCFHEHLNCPTGNSADQLRRLRTFGILPFLLYLSPEQTRYIFSFLTSAWRYIDGLSCLNYPEICVDCDQENSSAHVLFFCSHFCSIRSAFLRDTGVIFTIDVLSTADRRVQLRIARLGNDLFFAIQRSCSARRVGSVYI